RDGARQERQREQAREHRVGAGAEGAVILSPRASARGLDGRVGAPPAPPDPSLTLGVTVLLAAIAVAAFLRFDQLGAPSYWLDEILGDQLATHHAATAPWWRWITGLEHEHGPLYYATQLAARVAGHDEWSGRLPAALFGLAAIPLVFFAGRELGGWAAGIAAAIVLAVSPLYVYYSREARPYALLMLLAALMLLALLRMRIGLAIVAAV